MLRHIDIVTMVILREGRTEFLRKKKNKKNSIISCFNDYGFQHIVQNLCIGEIWLRCWQMFHIISLSTCMYKFSS